ncbi:conserved hypothetical protein [Perkinsus marinus ATCC 50983]|uniref:Mitochondrial carrier protein n=1 Tax=Perkinsus marinus (strain ATCC 50983 / TXsc) TaxID=423536 RepID=C5KFX0_PERM5|nr:conserved hypothetical protein [Perkinsus marinus ATCC 50983]EER16618.1 conserved hypothetical protein [Perkinsus marinus ATCC 50983]|eukprot:XP_002784822.1 conserved hypothetical protein [Perkinsus marinus ATCC 50983]
MAASSGEKATLRYTLVASTMGSVAVTAVCTPFDVVKNYWQASPALNHQRINTSGLQVMRHIKDAYGWRALWNGTMTSLVYQIPSNWVFFVLYEHWRERVPDGIASAAARATAVTIFSPLEFLRTRVQATTGMGEGAMATVKRVLREDSFSSFWRGLLPTLVRDLPFSAIYWSLYEYNKKIFLPDHVERRGAARSANDEELLELAEKQAETNVPVTWMETFGFSFLNGAVCGTIAAAATHPFDMVKTQLQTATRPTSSSSGHHTNVAKRIHTTGSAMMAIFEEYRLRGFTVGLGPRLLKVIPGCAIMLGTYEFCHAVADSLELDKVLKVSNLM